MLRARCISALAKAVYQDLVLGLYTPEEAEDFAPPLPPDAPPARGRLQSSRLDTPPDPLKAERAAKVQPLIDLLETLPKEKRDWYRKGWEEKYGTANPKMLDFAVMESETARIHADLEEDADGDPFAGPEFEATKEAAPPDLLDVKPAAKGHGESSMAPVPPHRPVLRYHGGKYRLAPWVISHFPRHKIYVEPFCGAASVLLAKPRSFGEVINDMDSDIISLFAVLRCPGSAAELARLVRLTPFSRREFERAFCPAPKGDAIEQARRLLVRSWMGFSTNGASARSPRIGFNGRINRDGKSALAVNTGFRAIAYNSFTTPAHDWARWPNVIEAVTARLAGVVLENRAALHVIQNLDGPDTLFYCDPPYLKSSRADMRDDYRFEMTNDDHVALAALLHSAQGMVVLSGYGCPLQEELYRGWEKPSKAVFGDRASKRRECLWLNPAASIALDQRTLFSQEAAHAH